MSLFDLVCVPAVKRQRVKQCPDSFMDYSQTEDCHDGDFSGRNLNEGNIGGSALLLSDIEPKRGTAGAEEEEEVSAGDDDSPDSFSDDSLPKLKRTTREMDSLPGMDKREDEVPWRGVPVESLKEDIPGTEETEDEVSWRGVPVGSPKQDIHGTGQRGEKVSWRGVPVESLRSLPSCGPQYKRIRPSALHAVMFKVPLEPGKLPEPYPAMYVDKWDSNHVKMPNSTASLYPVQSENGKKTLRLRWEVIEIALLKTMSSSLHLEEAILSYNTHYSGRWDFRGLHAFFTEMLEPEETAHFFSHTLPAMAKLALRLPQLLTSAVPLLRRGCSQSVSLSQLQIASLLANAFFCTFPRRNAQQKHGAEYSTFPDINFNRLFTGRKKGCPAAVGEKLKCLLNYFRRVCCEEPEGVVTFIRQHMTHKDLPVWERSGQLLPPLHITSQGLIEQEGQGMLHVDFANKFVGGGVIGCGCVQEEIRFVICPELIVSRLFTEVLDRTECLVIIGPECYSCYSGYADSFKWQDNYVDCTELDEDRRRHTTVVAVDALHFHKKDSQYKPEFIRRELNKAFVGFSNLDCPGENLITVATGNWGCGAFNGDPRLKALLQLMAASEAGREVMYFTFGDTKLRDQIYHMYTFLKGRSVTVGDLWRRLCQYSSLGYKDGHFLLPLYHFLYKSFSIHHREMGVRRKQDAGQVSRVDQMVAATRCEGCDHGVQKGAGTSRCSVSGGLDPQEEIPEQLASRLQKPSPGHQQSLTRVVSGATDLSSSGGGDKMESRRVDCEDTSVPLEDTIPEPSGELPGRRETGEQSLAAHSQRRIPDFFQLLPKS